MSTNFISYQDFLFEGDSAKEPEYGCVMLFAEVPDWHRLIRRLVRESDLYIMDHEYGYEEKPHITLLYGIHDDAIIDKSIIYSKIKEIPLMKITVKNVEIFSNDDNPYDVVKFTVDPTKQLTNLRNEFEEDLPNTQSFPEFNPHMTIAYVKKGEGEKYKRILKKGLKFIFNKGVYSSPDYSKVYIDLKTNKYKK